MSDKLEMKILLAAPRGFCAGVVRAIKMVEAAILEHGAPVYVRHQIVHNAHVVASLERKGAIFVKELDDIPAEHMDRPVLFSAHGVPKSVPAMAQDMNLLYYDATCPLVSKVHRSLSGYYDKGRQVILIGKAGHPEVIGTMGQVPEGAVLLVQNITEVQSLEVADPDNLSYTTQTTLSVDDTAKIVAALKARFPNIEEPRSDSICYATTNRQEGVKEIAPQAELFLIVGAANSSNTNKLVDTAVRAGCKKAVRVTDASELDWGWLGQPSVIGMSSGASVPEVLVDGVIDALRTRFAVSIEEVEGREETENFFMPKVFRQHEALEILRER